MGIKYTGDYKKFARELRKKMTKEEFKLWYNFLREYPIKFYRQRVISGYIVDFYCAKLKLAIEIDGSQHCEDEHEASDKMRDDRLKAVGITVVRIQNTQINQNFSGVCEYLQLVFDNLEKQQILLMKPHL